MGLLSECVVRAGRKVSAGTAQIQGETLTFRGDMELDISFEAMRAVSVEGDALVIKTDSQETHFELGAPVAARWASLIARPRDLFDKLEIGPQSRVAVVDVTDTLFLTALRERTAFVAEGRVPSGAPVIFFGAETKEALRKLPLLRARMTETGTLWIIRSKGSKAVAEADLRDAVGGAGLTDTTVVALSKTHTAHRCIIPVELRGLPLRPRPIVSMPPPAPIHGEPKADGRAETRPRSASVRAPAARKAPKAGSGGAASSASKRRS